MTPTEREEIQNVIIEHSYASVLTYPDETPIIPHEEIEDAADAVIRHIWDRAMSDEAVTVMVNRLDPYGIYTNDPVYQARWATSIIRTALAAVIGPRPEEVE